MKKSNSGYLSHGFTLLEILIALFIFTLLSLILASALRSVIDALVGTEDKALRLRKLQMTLLVISRDIEQSVNRPIINNEGKQDSAFIGKAHRFTFTHTGVANSINSKARSTLQRVAYQWSGDQLYKITWAVLDQPPKSQPNSRVLLADVLEAHFEYLDRNGRFYNEWPLNGQGSEALPRAVRVYLTIAKWGTITGLYLIPAEIAQSASVPGTMSPGPNSPPAERKS